MSGLWNHVMNTAFAWGDRLSMQQWLLVLVAVLAAGAFFLRGFGSRSNY